MSNYVITTLKPEHFTRLEELQRIVYPTLGAQELMRAEHFASQYTVFAEGQIVVLDGDRVIGQGSGFFTDFDFEHPATPSPRFATTSTFARTTRRARTTTAPTSAYTPTIMDAGSAS
jgi:hypothetical protein